MFPQGTFRWRPANEPSHVRDHDQCVFSSTPLYARDNRTGVIVWRMGCLHWLAHAARHGHVFGASTSRRIFLLLGPLSSFSLKPGSTNVVLSFPLTLSLECHSVLSSPQSDCSGSVELESTFSNWCSNQQALKWSTP